MTKADIIRMAREAGFLIDTHAQQYQPNCILSTHGLIDENLKRFADLVAAAERAECAKLCEDEAWRLKKLAVDTNSSSTNTKAIQASNDSDSIRARGTT
jgi:hypothetical protein